MAPSSADSSKGFFRLPSKNQNWDDDKQATPCQDSVVMQISCAQPLASSKAQVSTPKIDVGSLYPCIRCSQHAALNSWSLSVSHNYPVPTLVHRD